MNIGDRVMWWGTEDDGIVYTITATFEDVRLIVREDGWRKWVPDYELIAVGA